MAIMISCATDWTFDLFVEDAKTFKALPIKGVHCRSNASSAERFISQLKFICNSWIAENKGKCESWELERAFEYFFENEINFSDMYKDAYNQRPHLDPIYYMYALGYNEYINTLAYTFCSSSMKEKIASHAEEAKRIRESF